MRKFRNTHLLNAKRTLFDVFLWKMGYFKDHDDVKKIPKDFVYPIKKKIFDFSKPRVVWINHCTFLIQMKNVTILTDPIWNAFCSPFTFFGPKRRHPPAISLENLPHVDLVLISHDHYDHLDHFTVTKLFKKNPKIQWVVPLGVKKWFLKRNIFQVHEMNWHDKFTFGDLEIYAHPCQHFSGRNFVNQNTTLWTSYVLKHPSKQIFFAGDTGYNPYDFKNIGKRWEFFDLALIPIGTYRPYKFMLPVHVCPKESVRIHKEIGSKFSIGMHWKTFKLSDEDLQAPPYDLYEAMHRENLDPTDFIATEPGVFLNF